MIRETFQHIPGVGPWREKDLWARGIARWDDFPAEGQGVGISQKVDAVARARIALAAAALDLRDLSLLAQLMPAREHWRLYADFADEALYFDIETDGLETQRPTVVSVYDSDGAKLFIQGRNLESLPEAMGRKKLWVSFNGSCFDVPVLRHHFPGLPSPAVHVDLRFLCRRLKMPGGLKRIEEELGLGRPPHLRGMNGMDAVFLWRAYQRRGDVSALRFLAEYNLYDTVNLRTLMDIAYNLAVEHLACDVPKRSVFDRGEVLYDLSKLLLELGPIGDDLALLQRIRAEEQFL